MKEIYQYNTDQIIRGLCYSSSILCSSPESLIKHIQNISSIANIGDQEYLEKLNKILKYINKQSNRKLIDQDRALQLLLKNDIETILNLELENHDNPEEQLNKYFQKFQKIIKDLGLSVKVKIFIVDRYPKPYDKQTKGNAMQCDKDDEINFKINSGIYFRRQQLSPYISIFVLAHEIAHSFFNHKNDNRLARGLEEGIADIFAIYLCSKVMKYDILRNILINMRTMFSYDQFRYRYLDSLRQATVFYQKFGMVGIVDILKSGKTVGRYLLKDIEEKILRDKWGEIKLQCKKTRNIKKVDNILRFFLSYPNSSVVSPLALHVATKVDVNLKISTILRQNKIHNQQGINAINELQSILMLISYNNKIFYNELQSYLQSKTIKYKI